jgi:flagellar basal-body rod protein FlgG
MVRSLFTAATGMTAQQKNVDNIANNLANVNTQGFKKGRVIFEDLFYQELKAPGTTTGAGLLHPTGIQEGLGVNVVAIHKVFSQGNPQYTENPTDVTILGDGFYRVTLPNGDIGYTRQGAFEIDANGDLTTPQGYLLADNINIPEDILELNIANNGEVTAVVAGEEAQVELGQITLARFINPAGLMSVGENLFVETGASGGPIEGLTGDVGFGTTKQLFLEMSNVNVVDEMVNMITAQRAYEMNSKAIQTSDEMLQIANGLKR